MEFAYLDESGDPGAKGSKYLVLTLLCTSRKKEFIKIIRDTKKELLKKNKCRRWLSKHGGEIKFYGFPDKDILKRTLKKLSKHKANVYFLAFEKNNKPILQQIKTSILGNLFRHIYECGCKEKPQTIIADLSFFNEKKINRFLLMDYQLLTIMDEKGNEKLHKKGQIAFAELSDEEYFKLKDDPSKMIVMIEHRNSRSNEELQAVDLISGSIFASIEKNNGNYIDILNNNKFKINGSKLLKK